MHANYSMGTKIMKSNGTILLFYRYVTLENPTAIARWQKELCSRLKLTGRVLIGTEGINATLGGDTDATEEYKREFLAHELFKGTDIKESPGSAEDFPRLAVKVRNEIVHLGIDPANLGPAALSTHLSPHQAHELINTNPNLILLDARNNYESRIGTFRNAIIPPIENFRDFPAFVDAHAEEWKDKEVLMFCTGGIRCERAAAYVQKKGIEKVYQIDGGICRYAEAFPDGHFRGKNYVFDRRIALPVNDDILTHCDLCAAPSSDYTNCMNTLCNGQFIACKPCRNEYDYCCSRECQKLVAAGEVPARKDRVGI